MDELTRAAQQAENALTCWQRDSRAAADQGGSLLTSYATTVLLVRAADALRAALAAAPAAPAEPAAWGLLKPDGTIHHDLVGTKRDCEYWSAAEGEQTGWPVVPIFVGGAAAAPVPAPPDEPALKFWRAVDVNTQLVSALQTLLGQVMQARDGMGIWPYEGSMSMQETLSEVNDALAAASAPAANTLGVPMVGKCQACGHEHEFPGVPAAPSGSKP